MVGNIKPALLGSDMAGNQCHRNFDIKQNPAFQAMDVIVPLDSTVIPARLIGKRQLLNEPMLGKEMKRAIDRPIGNSWITPPYPLKYLAGSKVLAR